MLLARSVRKAPRSILPMAAGQLGVLGRGDRLHAALMGAVFGETRVSARVAQTAHWPARASP
jgi:hypothetical protein